MKKITLLLMVAILACLVMAAAVGCGDRNTPQENNPTDAQTQEPYEPTDEEIQAAIERYKALLQEGEELSPSPYIYITLTKEATREFKDYTANDFIEIGECSIDSDDKDKAEFVKAKMQGIPTTKNYSIDPETYQRKIWLEINQSGIENVVRACIILEKRNDVESARPSRRTLIYQNSGTPNATNTSVDWHTEINITDAWTLTQGSEDVLVGVMDTGIDGNHDNLNDNLDNTSKHRDFTIPNGENILLISPEDDHGHGTHIAGIIAAEGNEGISGIAPNVRLVSLKISEYNINDGNTYTEESWLKKAIEYANDNNIHILNFSQEIHINWSSFYEAIAAFDGLFICAAGNDGINIDSPSPNLPEKHYYPQEYSLDNIIVAGNCFFISSETPAPLSSSNFGNISVDLFAPGTDINSTVPTSTDTYAFYSDEGYLTLSGTSMSAAIISGVAALLYSYIPNISPLQVKTHIIENVFVPDGYSFLDNRCVTEGMILAYESLHITGTPTLYSSYNAQKHYVTYEDCDACGGTHTVKEPHTYGAWQYNNGTGHYHTCTECGYTETVAHTYAYVSQGSSEHSRTCSICGYFDNESHQLIYINLGIYQGHRRGCAKCSYTLCTEDHTWYYNNHTHINHCMKCNATAQYVPIIQNIEELE